MKADTSVKWFHSDMAAAPVLRGQAGALIEILDATLVNGFDVRVINSLVVADGVATATISAGHAYLQHAVIALSGATPAELNDEWRIKSVAGNTFSFDCDLPDGTATGTITVKMAPAGWAKVFAGANKAVYQSTDLAGTQLFLRVDDAGTTNVDVRGYEQMFDVDTGTGMFPASATTSNWPKHNSSSGGSTPSPWSLIGDRRLFHYAPAWHTSAQWAGKAAIYRFGDAISYLDGDAYHCIIASMQAPAASNNPSAGLSTFYGLSGAAGGCWLARGAGQSGGVIDQGHRSAVEHAGGTGTGESGRLLPIDGKMHYSPVFITDGRGTAVPLRGQVPGYYIAHEQSPVALPNFGIERISERLLMRVRVGYALDTSSFVERRFVAFDIEGPWR